MKRAVLAALACAAACAGSAGAGLPNGTSIGVTIDPPATTIYPSGGDVALTGTASVGTATADTTLVYVLDVSGSTRDVTGACPAESVYDRYSNTTLDCEIAAVKAVNQKAAGMDSVASVAAIGFGGTQVGYGPSGRPEGTTDDAQALDLAPADGAQPFVAPGAHTATSLPIWAGMPVPASDLEWALTSAYTNPGERVGGWPVPSFTDGSGFTEFTQVGFGGNTNYWAAINALHGIAAQITTPRTVVVFLSDGLANLGGPHGEPVTDALTSLVNDSSVSTHFTFDSFAVGSGAACNPSNAVGNLQQIANATPGGACTAITSTNAANVVPNVIGSTLTGVSFTVDGSAVSNSVSFTPPVSGPATQSWSQTFTGLGDGDHTICAIAHGTDAGGSGTSDSACADVTIKPKPVITLDDGGTVDEGSPFALSPTVTGATSSHWDASGGEGTCTFTGSSVTCDDEGDYTLTLTAEDGVNDPVSASETLHVRNVAPSLAIGSTSVVGRTVTFTGVPSDPGAGALTCTIVWGDGTTDTGECTTQHTYATGLAGATISAHATDDDGADSATVTTAVTFNRSPVCSAVKPTPSTIWPANNKLVLVTLHGATDPDGDVVTYRIDRVTQDEPGADWQRAAGGSVYVKATRLGSGNGRVYTIAYTVSDPAGATCTGTAKVTVPHDQR